MTNSIQHYLKSQGNPRIVSWGTHEGIRGATWIEMHADGSVIHKSYVPNVAAAIESRQTGIIRPERFQQLVVRLSLIRFEEFNSVPFPAPSTASISLECIWDSSRWEFTIPAHQVSAHESLTHLAEAFRRSAEEARNDGDDGPSQKMQQ